MFEISVGEIYAEQCGFLLGLIQTSAEAVFVVVVLFTGNSCGMSSDNSHSVVTSQAETSAHKPAV